MNQNLLYSQARRIYKEGNLEVWAKPLKHTLSGELVAVLINQSREPAERTFLLEEVGIAAEESYTMKNCGAKKIMIPQLR